MDPKPPKLFLYGKPKGAPENAGVCIVPISRIEEAAYLHSRMPNGETHSLKIRLTDKKEMQFEGTQARNLWNQIQGYSIGDVGAVIDRGEREVSAAAREWAKFAG